MKMLLCLCSLLLMSQPLGAETYSWVDDAGTWNFSEDLSSVPKKYRKKMRRLEDAGNAQVPQEGVISKNKTGQAEAPGAKPAAAVAGDKQLYDGKTQDTWRKEFDAHELELKRLELQLEQLQTTLKGPAGISRERQSALLKEYETLRIEYNERYKVYGDVIESARKAGLTVEIRK